MSILLWTFVLMSRGKYILYNVARLLGAWDGYWNASHNVL